MGGVPWFIGQPGAQHSAETARTLSYLAAGGRQGVVAPSHMKVQALAVPGGSVRVSPGACALINRQSAGNWRESNQSYISTESTEKTIAVPNNSSGVTRLHVLARVVEDSQYSSNAVPSDVVNGPYERYVLLTDVGADSRGILDLVWPYSGLLPLARISVPAGVGTIQQSHITDWRELVAPRIESKVLMNGLTNDVQLTSSGRTIWPTGFTPNVLIPWWATHMSVKATIASIGYMNGSVTGTLAVRAGAAGADQWRSADTIYDLDVAPGDGARTTLVVAGDDKIATALRGTVQQFAIEGLRSAFTGSGALVTRAGTHVIYEIIFREEPI